MQVEMSREKTFNMRLSEEEAARFDRVAAHYSLPVASMIRMLVKEKDAAIARDIRDLKEQFAGTKAKDSDIVDFARRRARVGTESETGATFALPAHLRIALKEASRGGAHGFEDVGFRVAREMRQLTEGRPQAEEALEHLLTDANADPLSFVRQYLPRIFEKVPAARRDAFSRGLTRALEDGEV